MRHGKANVAGGYWWIDEPGEDQPANFQHDDYPDVKKGSSVTFERDPGDFTMAIDVEVVAGFGSRELAESISADLGLSKTEARKAVDTIFAAIADAASSGKDVSLPGFGKFKIKHSAAREGRHPSTGAPIEIAASKRLVYIPAKALKAKLGD